MSRPLSRFAAIFGLLGAIVLAGCAPGPEHPMPQRLSPELAAEPEMPRFGPPRPTPPQRANSEIARDFLELSFFMESGRAIPRLSRFEGPITLRLTGQVPPGAAEETERLLGRLRNEAGIAVTPAPRGETAGITVEFVSRRSINAAVSRAACFIVPRVSSWEEFRRHRRSARLDWTTLERRERVAIFIPHDVPRQEIRDCLHEEIAQAMGPLNDLFRLTDSVFNDDNFQTVLTGFDMLILRAYYDDALESGMTRDEVAQRLPAILARLNPRGENIAPGPPVARSPRAWIDAVEDALDPGAARATRRANAARALQIARDQGWQGPRLAFSLFNMGRLSPPSEGEAALRHFMEAGRIYAELPAGEAHAAHVDMQLAGFALSIAEFEEVLRLTRRAQPAAIATENAALLASLKMVQAEALERLGRMDEARVVRLDSLGWARYGFGDTERVRARLSEIARLAPPRESTRAGG